MKRLLLLFVSAFFFLPFLCDAEEKAIFKMNEITANANDEIEVHVSLEHNPGFGVLSSKIVYDQEKLEFVSSEVFGLSNAMLKGAEKNLDGDISFFAITVKEAKLMEDNGEILVLTFKVKEHAKDDTEIQLHIENFGKNETENYDFEVQNGIVHFTNKTVVTPESSEPPLKEELPSEVQDKEITWKSSDEDVATVDSDGNVTFKKDGDVKITASNGDEVVFEKEYSVGTEENKEPFSIKLILLSSSIILLLFGGLCFYKLKK